jgi:hypothetical protein
LIKIYLEIPGISYPPRYSDVKKVRINNIDEGVANISTITWTNDTDFEVSQLGFVANSKFITDLKSGEIIIVRNSVIGSRELDLSGSRGAINKILTDCNSHENSATISQSVPIDPVIRQSEVRQETKLASPPVVTIDSNPKSQTPKWWTIPKDLSGCEVSTSPAEMLKKLHSEDKEYKVEEIKDSENNLLRVVVKTNFNGDSYSYMIYYKSLEDCKKKLEEELPSQYK